MNVLAVFLSHFLFEPVAVCSVGLLSKRSCSSSCFRCTMIHIQHQWAICLVASPVQFLSCWPTSRLSVRTFSRRIFNGYFIRCSYF